jgi:hypothetical protein
MTDEPTCALAPQEDTLGILDTFHDFCKSARISKKARAAGVKTDRLEIMRTYLPKLIQYKYPKKGFTPNYTENLKTLTCNAIKSVGEIEHEAEKMFVKYQPFKSTLDAHPETKETITFTKIIEAYKEAKNSTNNPVWNRFKDKLDIRMLEIQKGDFDFHIKESKEESEESEESNESDESTSAAASEDEDEKEQDYHILALFVLHFFFFGDIEKTMYYITFDANSRFLGKIFKKKTNVSNVIFPQTIADSATTSFSALGAPNTFLFPSINNTVDFTSNYFSKDKYKIFFQNNAFSNSNKFGFSICIESKPEEGKKEERVKLELPFGPTQTEGPSVNYLVDLLERAQAGGGEPYASIKKKGTILDIGTHIDSNAKFRTNLEATTKKQENGLLPDLKRGGDHEAVLAAKYAASQEMYKYFMFSTIDILCAMRARLERLNTVYQGTDKMIMYRNVKFLPTETKKLELILKAKEIVTLVQKLDILLGITLPAQLAAAKEAFAKAKAGLVPFGDKPKEPVYRRRCEEMLNALLRLRMVDLETYAEKIKSLDFEKKDKKRYEPFRLFTKLFEFELLRGTELEIKNNMDLLQKRMDVNGIFTYTEDKITKTINIPENYEKMVTIYNEITSNVTAYISVDLKVVQSGATFEVMPPNSLIDEQNKFTMQENSAFEFYPGSFVNLYEIMMYINDIAYKNKLKSARGGDRDYPKIMNRILKEDSTAPFQYFKAVEDVLEQFKTPELKGNPTFYETLQNILDFRKDIALYDAAENPRKADVILNDAIEFLVGDSFEETIQTPARGVVNKILKLYESQGFGTPIATVPYVPAPVAAVAAKKPKRGGGNEKPDILQYYDLSDLLYNISSRAAAYIESAYSQEYFLQFVGLQFQAYEQQSSLSLQQKFAFANKIIGFLQNCKERTIKGKSVKLREGKTITSFQVEAENIIDQFNRIDLKNNDTGTKLDTLLETGTGSGDPPTFSVKKLLQDYTPEAPTINEFLSIVDSYKYNDEIDDSKEISASQALYEEIGALWKAGLYEIENNENYTYHVHPVKKGLNTENLLTLILTLRKNEGGVIESDIPNELELKSISKFFAGVTVSIPTFMLLYLTLIENILQKEKQSFFLNKTMYVNKLYDTPTEWNNKLYSFIYNLFRFTEQMTTKGLSKKFLRLGLLKGGSYPAETRRVQANTKHNKTRKLSKH